MKEQQIELLKRLDVALGQADVFAHELDKIGWPEGLPSDVKAALLARLQRLREARKQAGEAQEDLISELKAHGIEVHAHHARVGVEVKRICGIV